MYHCAGPADSWYSGALGGPGPVGRLASQEWHMCISVISAKTGPVRSDCRFNLAVICWAEIGQSEVCAGLRH